MIMAFIKLASAAAVGLLLVSATGASAYDGYRSKGSRIDAIQHKQSQNIERGRRDGSLTRYEYRRLKVEQGHIAAMERRAKADGHLSIYERARIAKAQREARRHIANQRHDSQTTWWRRNW